MALLQSIVNGKFGADDGRSLWGNFAPFAAVLDGPFATRRSGARVMEQGRAMTSRFYDDAIKMERRHIREAMVWIAKQEEIVVRLDLMEADELALQAREPLIHFCSFLAFARDRLGYFERKRSNNASRSKL